MIRIYFLLLALSVYGFADLHTCFVRNKNNPAAEEPNPYKPLLELRGGYFFFSSSKMRKIYDEGGGDVGLSGSYPIWKWVQIYGGLEYLERHGKSLAGHQKTKIWEVPLSAGLKAVVLMGEKAHYYITLGPRYFFVHMGTHSSYVDKNLNRNGFGGFANMGFNFFPRPHWLLDVFGEYSYKRMSFQPSKHNSYGRKVQIGGFAFGAGIGYAF